MAEVSTRDSSGEPSFEVGNAGAKVRYAGIGQRLMAFYVDLIVIRAVCSLVDYLTSHFFARSHVNWGTFEFYLTLPYCAAFELSPMQATPGKRFRGFFVAAADRTRLSWWWVVLRNLLRYVYFLPIFCRPVFDGLEPASAVFFMVGVLTSLLFCLADPRRRMWYDLLTGSVHYRRPSISENSLRPAM